MLKRHRHIEIPVLVWVLCTAVGMAVVLAGLGVEIGSAQTQSKRGGSSKAPTRGKADAKPNQKPNQKATRKSNAAPRKSASAPRKPPVKAVSRIRPKAPAQARTNGTPTVAARVASPGESGEADWLRSLPSKLRTVRSVDRRTGVPIGETLGLVIEGVFVLVPLEFIEDQLLARFEPRHHIVEDSWHEARLVEVDLAAGLAVLRAAQTSSTSASQTSLWQSQIRSDIPSFGEPMTVVSSIGSVQSGLQFRGTRNDGVNLRYLFAGKSSTAFDPGFVFDRSGFFIGYAPVLTSPVRGGGQVLSSVSTRMIWETLRRLSGRGPAAAISPREERQRQLSALQEVWTRELLAEEASGISLRQLECGPRLLALSDVALSRSLRSTKSFQCANRFPVSLGFGYQAGFLLESSEVVLKSSLEPGAKPHSLLNGIAEEMFSAQTREARFVNLMTATECRASEALNRKGQTVLVRFCTSGLKNAPGFSDTVIAIARPEDGARHMITAARLKGFNQVNSRRVLELLVETGGVK